MRVDFATFGVEPPENSKPGRAGQAGNGPTGAADNAASTAVSGNTSSSAPGIDQTRFSFDQARVQSLQTQVLAQPEIREAKVQSLRQAIDNGEYSVPASHVADALVSDLGGVQG